MSANFVFGCLTALKKLFIKLESSPLKRAALIFMFSKIYFTDDIAIILKLRITSDEWNVFKGYLNEIRPNPSYKTICVMFYQLFNQHFFRFTMKAKALAIDYGKPEVHSSQKLEIYNNSTEFSRDIRNEIEKLENVDVADLHQLNALREEAMKPFEEMFPEKDLLTTTLKQFDAIKNMLKESTELTAPKMSQKEVNKACEEFLKASSSGPSNQRIDLSEPSDESDYDFDETPMKIRRTRSSKTKEKKKTEPAPPKQSDSESQESDKEFKNMKRRLGFRSQNVMKGIGVDNNEKLKFYYDRVFKM